MLLAASGCGGGWGAPVLQFGAVVPRGPMPGVSLFIVFVVSLSFIVLSLSLWIYRSSFGTVLSYRYRTIIPNLSVLASPVVADENLITR